MALRSQEEIHLLQEEIKSLFRFKILMLGGSESGKSTIVRQLKLMHKHKLCSKEKLVIAQGLHQNLLDCMKILIHQVMVFNEHQLIEEDAVIAHQIEMYNDQDRITPELGQRILRLYNSQGIQHAYARRNEFWLLDSFEYLLKNIPRFCASDFTPTQLDCAMLRIRTGGIVVTHFKEKLNQGSKYEPDHLDFEVVDVGGQRSERKKWMHTFDDLSAVVYVSSLTGYNQVLFEDNSKIRMIEELELFEKIIHNKIFENTPIFLLLTKRDLLEDMVQKVDFKTKFPDYDGGNSLNAKLEFIRGQYQVRTPADKMDRYGNPTRQIFELIDSLHFFPVVLLSFVMEYLGQVSFVEFLDARSGNEIQSFWHRITQMVYENKREKILQKAEELTKEKEALQTGGPGADSCCLIS